MRRAAGQRTYARQPNARSVSQWHLSQRTRRCSRGVREAVTGFRWPISPHRANENIELLWVAVQEQTLKCLPALI
ncbi:hypothetical protein R1flu_008390 [Riccia fluitans]|uniref:Transposase n=1 Tax=Riccia fluitans TaxID=41844 RepID=A0ABD1YBR8_9MARC